MLSNSRLIVLLALLTTALFAIPAHADWVDDALALQEQLDVDEPFTRTFWIGTHNSYNAYSWDSAYTYDANQYYSPTDQLDMGARELTFDIYRNVYSNLVMCHGTCHPLGNEKKLSEGLEAISDWIDDGNEDSVILLKLELEDNYTSVGEKLASKLGTKIYQPFEGEISISSNPSGCHGLEPEHITKAKVLAAGKNVVVITTPQDGCPDNDTFESWVHVGLEYEVGGFENKFSKPKAEDSDLDDGEELIGDCKSFYDAGKMTRLHDGNTFNNAWGFSEEEQHIFSDNVEDLMDCGLNVFELFNYGNVKKETILSIDVTLTSFSALEPEDMVWSWATNEPVDSTGEEDCAVLDESTRRFEAQSCSTSHSFACYDASAGTWAVTGYGSFEEAQVACQDFGETYSFTAPTHPRSKSDLLEKMSTSEQVWINYQDLETEGDWVINQDYLYATVIDNDDALNTSPGGSEWTESTAVAGYTGANYQVASGSDVGYPYFLWMYEVPEKGWYQVSARWTSHSNRGTASYRVIDSYFTGNKTYGTALEDQTAGGGQDNVLGCFFVNTSYIMTYMAPADDNYVAADSITFKRLFDQSSASDCGADSVTEEAPVEMFAMNYNENELSQGGTLYQVSVDSAISTDVGDIYGDHTCVSDMAFQPGTGTLFAINCDGYQGSGDTLFTIDSTTGEATKIGTLTGDRTAATSIAFHPDEPDYLYAMNRGGDNWGSVLYKIDVTDGTTTELGSLWGDRTHATSLAFDVYGTLYAVNNAYTGGSGSVLFTIDPSTQETTEIADFSGDRTHATSIRFDADNTLYGFNYGWAEGVGNVLFTIDPSDATTQQIAWLNGDRTAATSMAIRH